MTRTCYGQVWSPVGAAQTGTLIPTGLGISFRSLIPSVPNPISPQKAIQYERETHFLHRMVRSFPPSPTIGPSHGRATREPTSVAQCNALEALACSSLSEETIWCTEAPP